MTGASDAGARVLAAALNAMPSIRFTTMRADLLDLTPTGMNSLAPALRRPWGSGGGLRALALSNNPRLGDDGIQALAAVLPASLEVRIMVHPSPPLMTRPPP